jgi:protein SCO1/2
MKNILCILAISAIFLSAAAAGAEGKNNKDVGVTEKLGSSIPLDLSFTDENGAAVKLSSLVNRPAILSFVYYGCDRFCPLMLGGLANTVSGLNLRPGKDYQIVTISIDENDIPQMAREKKVNYIKAAGQNFPADAWKFLTGRRETIEKITDAAGYSFRKESHGFIHPAVLIVVSPQGKIVRYLNAQKIVYAQQYPVTFSAVELTDSIYAASKGKVIGASQAAAQLCFPHEPINQEKFFRLLTVTGWVTVFSLAFFFVYLKITSRKY